MKTSEASRPDGRQARWEGHNAERRQHLIDAATTRTDSVWFLLLPRAVET